MREKMCFTGMEWTREKIRDWIAGFFILLILIVHPLILNNYYSDVLETKYKFYYITMIAMFLMLLISSLVIRKREERRQRKALSLVDWAMLAFLFSAIISTVCSDYKYEAFWGNEGRLNGLFLLAIYTVSYFCISRFWEFRDWYVKVFLIASLVVCIYGIGDFFHVEFFQIEPVVDQDSNIFTSTLGNINVYTSYVVMAVAVSSVCFFAGTKREKKIIYYICMIVTMLALITGQSDNGYLAMGALAVILPFWLFRTTKGIGEYFIFLAAFCTAIIFIGAMSASGGTIPIDGITKMVAGSKPFVIFCVVLWLIAGGCFAFSWKKVQETMLPKWIIGIWGIFLVVFAGVIIYMLYDCNIAGNCSRYGALGGYLLFDDAWGNYRGYAWKLFSKIYMDFPMIKKLFGCGPDTLAILAVQGYLKEMISTYNAVFSSAHNEYLQYLVTIGAVGTISYITAIIGSIAAMVKRGKENPIFFAIAAAILCYSAQAVVNINTPIVTPIMFVLLAMGNAKKMKTGTA
ncbi:O-antigen ligase domain-containing protein [Clostridium sp. MCC353]|uniref:O-antigen ligase family protein n=1 Tax=Clostridium sp. MCC353 TaxID=2592646 RepID=UPI001C0190C0|nr:O-antigen ligase family protein [Clostridium sp. MCC353]MBT9778347.1 O-antigen ligase domain-containing protein [Clostridium sp. MCC353]